MNKSQHTHSTLPLHGLLAHSNQTMLLRICLCWAVDTALYVLHSPHNQPRIVNTLIEGNEYVQHDLPRTLNKDFKVGGRSCQALLWRM